MTSMISMRDACGATGPLTFAIEAQGKAAAETREFEAPFVLIGGDRAADLCLPHKEVGERHAYLQVVAGRVLVVDLGSRGGTFIDKQRVQAAWLDRSQTLRVGPFRIRLASGDVEGEPEPVPAAVATLDDPALPLVHLEIMLRGIRKVPAQVRSRLALIGSAADCQLRLLDPSVSPYHGAMLQTPTGLWIVDLLGQGGTLVNDASVRCAAWEDGDEIKVGRSSIRLKGRMGSIPAANGSGVAASASIERTASQPVIAKRAASETGPPAPHLPMPASASAAPASSAPKGLVRSPAHGGSSLGAAARPAPVHPLGTAAEARATPLREPQSRDGGRATPPPKSAPAGRAPTRPPETPAPDRQVAEAYERGEQSGSRERRSSCRYVLSETRAQLAWWLPATLDEVEPQPKAAESCTYTALMSRGPGFRTGSMSPREGTEVRNESTVPQEFVKSRLCQVLLLDVSQSGLSVLGGEPPAPGRRIWLRLQGGQATDWVEVALVGSKPEGQGTHLIRLTFRELCPYDMFKELVLKGTAIRD